ncbi:hypothetical protein JAAARDRAFT_37590 [Jaapia argillacea MUCL 33604]|uniref:Uncharacterized protein n=1 Tax=Jaapia argillacea MUCL 33604 TaxID=933084 RepID=A0A067PJU4_9AGAM|nr:hypothetical protein JAAARDRAFT_37590 [Jaapia argillacea MUCL 33604]
MGGRQHFLCCLPLRLGALMISFCQFFVNGFSAALAWYVLVENHQTQLLNTRSLVQVVLGFAIVTTVSAIFCFIGFVGAIRKRTSYIKTYARIVALFLIIKIIFAVIEILSLYINPSGLVNACIDGSTDPNVAEECNNFYSMNKWIVIVTFVIPVFIESYGLLIIHQYGTQLASDSASHFIQSAIALETGSAFSPYPPAKAFQYQQVSRPSSEALHSGGKAYDYPYSDERHSYGNGGKGYHG